MSIVNLNDLLPTAYPGMENVLWQYQLYPDGRNRYISACYRPGLGQAYLHTGSYTAVNDDSGKLLSFLISADAILTLPATPPRTNWSVFVENLGAADLRVVSTINVDGTTDAILIPPNQGLTIFTSSTGDQYYTLRGLVAPATQHSIGGINLSADVGGTAQTATVVGLQRVPISTATPVGGQVLQFIGSQWAPGIEFSTATPTSGQVLEFINNQWTPVTINVYGGPGSGFVGTGIGRVIQETPAGSVDGLNTNFYLTYVPLPQLLILARDNSHFHPGVQYTLSGNVITFAVAPPLGALITATYFLGPGTVAAAPTVVTATLNFTTANTPNPSTQEWGGGISRTPISLFGGPYADVMHDPSTWAKRSQTFTLSNTDYANLLSGSFYLLVTNYHIGSGVSSFSPPDVFDIYELSITVSMSDGSTQTWLPTAFASDATSNGTGTISNEANAYDGDPNTYAEISATSYASFQGGIVINYQNWVRTA